MLIDWLYRTTLETSLLIGLILLIRTPVRKFLGARAAYWLWFIPLIRVLIPERPPRPTAVLEAVGLPGGQLDIAILPNPDVLVLPTGVPLAAVCVTGTLIWVGIRVFTWDRFRRLLRVHATRCDGPAEIIARLPDRLRRLDTRYFSCSVPGAPFLTGLFRPSVYLPQDFGDRFSVSEQKCIVHHELMHFLRRDLWMQAVWETLRTLFWFNPVIHIAALALRDDQEFACDQSVLDACSADERFHYARALFVGAGPYLLPPTMAFFSKPKERILMIEKHQNSKARNVAGLCLCSLVGILTLTKAPLSMAQEKLEESLSLNFQLIPLENVIELFADFTGMTITGVEQVAGPIISIRVSDVPAHDALMQLLNCVGHTFESDGETLEIIPLTSGIDDASFECIDVEIQEDRTL